STPLETIERRKPKGIILSGGPDSVYEQGAPSVDRRLSDMDIPGLGVCYGMQLMAKELGGRVEPASQRACGFREIDTVKSSVLLEGMRKVGMSHGDRTLEAHPGLEITARSEATIAAREDPARE